MWSVKLLVHNESLYFRYQPLSMFWFGHGASWNFILYPPICYLQMHPIYPPKVSTLNNQLWCFVMMMDQPFTNRMKCRNVEIICNINPTYHFHNLLYMFDFVVDLCTTPMFHESYPTHNIRTLPTKKIPLLYIYSINHARKLYHVCALMCYM